MITETVTFSIHSYKDEGLLYPKGEKQEELMREFYQDLKLDPRMVSYVEAHGTGTCFEMCRNFQCIFVLDDVSSNKIVCCRVCINV